MSKQTAGDDPLAPVRRVYLLYGEEEVGKWELVARIRRTLLEPGFEDMDGDELDVRSSDISAILSSAAQLPMTSERRVVVVRGAETLRRRERSADAEALAAGISRLGADSCLVLVAAPPADDRSKSRTALTAKVDAAVRDAGLVVQFERMSEEALREWAVARARTLGVRLEPEAARLLLQAAQWDRVLAGHELEKVSLLVGDRDCVTPADVEAVCTRDPEDTAFRIIDAVIQRKPNAALTLLRETLHHDPRAHGVAGRLLALLALRFRHLWQAQELMALGVNHGGLGRLDPALSADLPGDCSITAMAWKARTLFDQARVWGRADLMKAFTLMMECDAANKGGEDGAEDVVLNLEILVTRLCRQDVSPARVR